jgi:SlyX protein
VDVDARINELESRLAFQDDTLQALNDALVAQQRLLERVQLQMAALIKRQEEVGSQFGMAEDEAPPPHY